MVSQTDVYKYIFGGAESRNFLRWCWPIPNTSKVTLPRGWATFLVIKGLSGLLKRASRNASLSAEWFLSDQDLLGSVDSTGTTTGGLYINIHVLNILDTTIDCFNKEQMNRGGRYTSFGLVLDKWKPHRNEFKSIIVSLEDTIKRCAKFLQSS